ncbi:hypothetical protein [Arthrobacter sp. B3I4]|uniref:hypothetical protein n=1 Tax=Arthrobacter sp. B3I4 TaxID=3042267 RepID=UPI0027D9116A|nr:hypothetical protein [Arthrobacter sp. B3I4]
MTGSRSGEGITVYVWYGGRLAYPDALPVSDWQFSWDRTRQVQTFDITVADKDGKLAPWLLEDPLGVGGSRLQVRYNVGGAGSINLGWYRITRPSPDERWHSYRIDDAGRVNPDSPVPAGKKDVLVSGGATIRVQANDLAVMIKADQLLAPESPQGANPTVVGEIRRLAGDIVPVVAAAGVTDRPVNKTLIYERDRLDAIQALCKSIACDYRMNGEGQLEVYPVTKQAPVATLKGGEEGLLVKVDREQQYDGLYNRFVVTGTGTDTPVRAIAEITAGPLSVYGPHGRVPTFYESNMISTRDQAYDYARTMKDTHLAGLTVDLKVTCLPIPHVQQGDWVNVGNPVVNGQAFTLAGMVKAINQPSNGTVPGPCTVVVECSYTDVQTALAGVDRG